MQNYHFFLEYAKGTIAQKYTVPDEIIYGDSINYAVRRFANKKKMRLSGWESLIENGWRAYYMSKGIEHVYYIEEAP